VPAVAAADSVEVGECAAAVVAEVEKLPDKFRLPVLLCFFEDCTHAEAANRLGWAVGTVASRLARAKDRLRESLSRKGFALPMVLAGATVTGVDVRAAVAMATTPSAVPAGVSELTREVLYAMWNAKAKLVGGGVLAVCLAGGFGLTVLTAGPQPEQPKAKAAPKAKAPEKPIDAELKKLQGLWRVTKIDTERGSAPAKELEGMRWRIVGDLLVAQDSPDQKQQGRTRLTIDPAKSPKWITTTLEGVPKGDTLKRMDGIYELKGDTLRICTVASGQVRPTEFKVGKAVECGLIELERVPDAIKSLTDLAGEWRVLSVTNDGKQLRAEKPFTAAEVHRDVLWLDSETQSEKFVVRLDAGNGFIDLMPTSGLVGVRGTSLPGRFTWKDNRLTIAIAEPGQSRPAEATSGKGVIVFVLERKIKK